MCRRAFLFAPAQEIGLSAPKGAAAALRALYGGGGVKGGCVLSFAKENTPFGWQPRPALHHHPVQRAESRRTEHRHANTLCKDTKRPPAKSPVAFIFTFDNNKI